MTTWAMRAAVRAIFAAAPTAAPLPAPHVAAVNATAATVEMAASAIW